MSDQDGILKDFDWQLNIALSSDKLASLNQPLVNVDLDIISNQTSHCYKSLEMNGQELSTFVSALESAGQALQQAKS